MIKLATLFCSTLLAVGLTTQPALADAHDKPASFLSQFTLTLNNDDSHCTLIASKKDEAALTIPLLLESPCYWVSHEEAAGLLQFSYPEKNAEITMLVAGTTLDWTDDKKEYMKLPTDKVCSQYLQGIIIDKNELFAVDEKMDAPHCKGLMVDEKVFQQAADTEKRYQQAPENLSKTRSESGNSSHSTAVKDPSTAAETEEESSFFGTIQKTIKQVFSTED